MKKIAASLVLGLIGALTIACGSNSSDDGANTPNTNTSTGTLHLSQDAVTCGPNEPRCAKGQCVNVKYVNPSLTVPICIEGDPCAAIVCASGRRCSLIENIPGDLVCDGP